MQTPKEIAQWVIDNRWPKNENEKVSDSEMYHSIIDSIEKLLQEKEIDQKDCCSCKYENKKSSEDPCYGCSNFNNNYERK